jgi:apolipoprotein N-acyltransferase
LDARRVVTALVGFGPALAWAAWITLTFRPALGWGRAIAVAAFTGLGVLGLSALVLAWMPWLLERAGLRRAGAWLRRHWDEDAR